MENKEIEKRKQLLEKAFELMNEAEGVLRDKKGHEETIENEELKDKIEQFTVIPKSWYMFQIERCIIKLWEIDHKYYSIIQELA